MSASPQVATDGRRLRSDGAATRARMLEAVSAGAAGSWMLSNLAPRILNGDLNPGFMVKLHGNVAGSLLIDCITVKVLGMHIGPHLPE